MVNGSRLSRARDVAAQASAIARVGLAITLAPLVLLAAPNAEAKITVKVKESTRSSIRPGPQLDVRINGDASDDRIVLSLEGSFLKVNGSNPAGQQVDFSEVLVLHVRGRGGDDQISLRGIRDFGAIVNRHLAAFLIVAGDHGDDLLRGLGTSESDLAALGPNGEPATTKGSSTRFGRFGDLLGGKGNDVLLGSRGSDSIFGGSGNDRIRGFGRPDHLSGGPGADRIWGGENANKRDLIYGGAGNDLLFGGPGDDKMLGKQGVDKLVGGPGRDVMYQNTESRRGYGPNGGCEGAPPGLCNPIIN